MTGIVSTVWAIYLPAAGFAATVEVEIFVEPRAPITAAQEWLGALASAGLTHVRIRAKQPSDQVGIEVRGPKAQPTYRISGMINSGNELVLPSGRYRLSQARLAVRWIEEVAQKGPAQKTETGESGTPMGLSAGQLQKLRQSLAQPVAAPTNGKDRAEVVQQICAQLALPVRIDQGQRSVLAGRAVAEDLQGISAGTALAYVLRSAGLCLAVSGNGAAGESLMVRPLVEGPASWPVGWPPDKPAPELLPALFESFHANLQNVPVTQAIEAIGKRLGTPVLWDHSALRRHGIDPAKVLLTVPRTRTTHHGLMRRVLAKAQLRYEVRVDDAGKAFVWIAAVKDF